MLLQCVFTRDLSFRGFSLNAPKRGSGVIHAPFHVGNLSASPSKRHIFSGETGEKIPHSPVKRKQNPDWIVGMSTCEKRLHSRSASVDESINDFICALGLQYLRNCFCCNCSVIGIGVNHHINVSKCPKHERFIYNVGGNSILPY